MSFYLIIFRWNYQNVIEELFDSVAVKPFQKFLILIFDFLHKIFLSEQVVYGGTILFDKFFYCFRRLGSGPEALTEKSW